MSRVTNAQLDKYLETIAKRLEEKPSMTPKIAAQIVRESKISDEKQNTSK
jgi:hypothetical protein